MNIVCRTLTSTFSPCNIYNYTIILFSFVVHDYLYTEKVFHTTLVYDSYGYYIRTRIFPIQYTFLSLVGWNGFPFCTRNSVCNHVRKYSCGLNQTIRISQGKTAHTSFTPFSSISSKRQLQSVYILLTDKTLCRNIVL